MSRHRIDPYDETTWEHPEPQPRSKGPARNQSRCEKVRFHSHKQAVSRLHDITSMESPGKKPVRSYHCGRCKGWHLTSQPTPGPSLGDLLDLEQHRVWKREQEEGEGSDDDDDPTPPEPTPISFPTPKDVIPVFLAFKSAA